LKKHGRLSRPFFLSGFRRWEQYQLEGDISMPKLTIALAAMAILALSSPSWPEEVTYRNDIKPLFNAQCMKCHGATSPEYSEFKANQKKYRGSSQGPRMDRYTYLVFFIGWPDTGALMRRLDDGKNTKEGKPGNMYPYLGATEEERQRNLKIFKEWVGNWTLERFPEITKEELNGIRVHW